MMPKKKDQTDVLPEKKVSGGPNKKKLARDRRENIKQDSWAKEERKFEDLQKARVKEVERRIFKGEDYLKHKKADKKIGGVRGKFHPSLERTRKRT